MILALQSKDRWIEKSNVTPTRIVIPTNRMHYSKFTIANCDYWEGSPDIDVLPFNEVSAKIKNHHVGYA